VIFIPDDVDEIARAVQACAAEFDHVFTSGGIGPTHDDVTIEGVARAFGRTVVRNRELEAIIRGYFGDGVDESRLRMADAPDGAEIVRAEGLRWPVLAVGSVYILPGVPEHFRSKFDALRERFRAAPFHIRTIYTKEDEFDLAPRLNQVAADNPDVEIGSYPNFTRDDYKVKVTIESKEGPAVERAFAELLGLLEASALAGTD
jgi:molybdopterin-biosynthesis enzyme MoeA-like protein